MLHIFIFAKVNKLKQMREENGEPTQLKQIRHELLSNFTQTHPKKSISYRFRKPWCCPDADNQERNIIDDVNCSELR